MNNEVKETAGKKLLPKKVAVGANNHPIRPAHSYHIGVAAVSVSEELDSGLKRLGRVHTQELTEANGDRAGVDPVDAIHGAATSLSPRTSRA